MTASWTVEPWSFHAADPKYPGDGNYLIAQASRIVARIEKGSNPKEKAEMIANGERLEACVNACVGIPSAALEVGIVTELVQAAERCLGGWTDVRNRDALRAVLAKLESK